MKDLIQKWKSLPKETRLGVYFGLGAFLLFLLDLISKWVVENCLEVGQMVTVIPNFFYLTKSYNTGAAFSLGANWGVGGRILGIAISVLMSGAILWYWIVNNKKIHNLERVCLMLLSSGAVGNLIDRAFYWEGTTGFNGVIDFLQFYLGGGPSAPNSALNPFATFNVADACLTIGVVLLIVALVIDAIKNSKNDPNEKDPRLEKKHQAPSEENTSEEKKGEGE